MSALADQFVKLETEINSASQEHLRSLATGVQNISTESTTGGTMLRDSALLVGERDGAPYEIYQNRLLPTAEWLAANMSSAAETLRGQLQSAADVVGAAQDQAKASRAALQGLVGPALEAALPPHIARLEAEQANMTAAFGQIQPGDTGTPPVAGAGGGTGGGAAGGGGTGGGGAPAGGAGAGADPGGAAGGEGPGAESGGGSGDAGMAAAAAVPGAGGMLPAAAGTGSGALGPDSGQYAGWVTDPETGNLIDPATGREVNGEGRFIDPVTGEPFGDPSQYATRLEGVSGGAATGGLLSPAAGGFGAAGAVLPAGGLGGLGGGGAGGNYAGFYGGVVPPSMAGAGRSPVGGELHRRAADNLALRAGTAQNILAGGTGQAHPGGYVPPMGGAGAGGMAGAGGRGNPRGRGLVTESGSVWGATGRGAARDGRRTGGSRTEVVEDADVWTSGDGPTGAGALGER